MPSGTVTCPTCGAPVRPERRPVRDGRYTYAFCPSCRSGWLDPLPETDPVELYGADYFLGGGAGGYVDYDGDAELHRRNARNRLGLLSGALGDAPGALLDVGCASGYLLQEASARGWRVAGVEVSATAREIARHRGLLTFPDLDAVTAAVEPGTLDAVSYFQVLEHTADPLTQLETVRPLLRPGGVVVIETWDVGSPVARAFGTHWQQVNPPSVVHLFTRQGLRTLLRRSGLNVEGVRATSKWVSVGLAAGMAAHKIPSARTALHRVAAGRVGAIAVPYRLGDLVTAIARVPPAR